MQVVALNIESVKCNLVVFDDSVRVCVCVCVFVCVCVCVRARTVWQWNQPGSFGTKALKAEQTHRE